MILPYRVAHDLAAFDTWAHHAPKRVVRGLFLRASPPHEAVSSARASRARSMGKRDLAMVSPSAYADLEVDH